MPLKLSNIMSGYVMMAIILSLYVTIYVGFEDGYGFTRDGTDSEGKNIAERLNDLNLIEGMNSFVTGLYQITNPGNVIDIIGGFLSTGIGTVQTIGGVITSPIEIFGIITEFYYLPPIIPIGLGTLFTIYVGFAILNKKTGGAD